MNMLPALVASIFIFSAVERHSKDAMQDHVHLAEVFVTESETSNEIEDSANYLIFPLEPEPAPPGEQKPQGSMSFGTTVNVQSPKGQRLALSLTQMPIIDAKPGMLTYVSTTTGCQSPSFVADLAYPRLAEAIVQAQDPMGLITNNNSFKQTLAETLCRKQRRIRDGQLYLVSQGELIGSVNFRMRVADTFTGRTASQASGYTLDRNKLIGAIPTYIQRLWLGPVKRTDSEFNALLEDASTAEAFHLRAIKGPGAVSLAYDRIDAALVDQDLLDTAVAQNFPPSLALKAHILMQEAGLYNAKPSERRLQKMDQARVAEIEIMVARAASRFLPAQTLIASLRRQGLNVDMNLARGGVPDVAAMTRQRNIENALLRRLNTDALKRACEDIRGKILAATSDNLVSLDFLSDKCRINMLSGAFYTDLWFQNVEVFGCKAGTCNYRTVNQCYAQGTIAWGACGEWVDGPWRGQITVDNDGRILAVK